MGHGEGGLSLKRRAKELTGCSFKLGEGALLSSFEKSLSYCQTFLPQSFHH
jgi:hypothetical protein